MSPTVKCIFFQLLLVWVQSSYTADLNVKELEDVDESFLVRKHNSNQMGNIQVKRQNLTSPLSQRHLTCRNGKRGSSVSGTKSKVSLRENKQTRETREDNNEVFLLRNENSVRGCNEGWKEYKFRIPWGRCLPCAPAWEGADRRRWRKEKLEDENVEIDRPLSTR